MEFLLSKKLVGVVKGYLEVFPIVIQFFHANNVGIVCNGVLYYEGSSALPAQVQLEYDCRLTILAFQAPHKESIWEGL